MFYLGHTHIDILKVDIESWEFDTMTTLVDPYIVSGKPLPFGQLQMEIHIWDRTFEYFLTWWEKLEKAGLRPFWTEVRVFTPLKKKSCVVCSFDKSFLFILAESNLYKL